MKIIHLLYRCPGGVVNSSRSSRVLGTYVNIRSVGRARVKETKEGEAKRDFRSLSTGTKCRNGGGWCRQRREALIEFGFVWIIVKRLKRPETNLFASGSFLVEDNKWSTRRPARKLRHKSFAGREVEPVVLPLFLSAVRRGIGHRFLLQPPLPFFRSFYPRRPFLAPPTRSSLTETSRRATRIEKQ